MSNNKIYVGNLGFSTTNEALSDAFAQYGTVTSARIITDRDTNRSKGFGFVEMGSSQEAASAISSLNGSELDGRQLNVSEAKPKTENTGFRSSRY
jgi:cold-inducible RNA-binding protein